MGKKLFDEDTLEKHEGATKEEHDALEATVESNAIQAGQIVYLIDITDPMTEFPVTTGKTQITANLDYPIDLSEYEKFQVAITVYGLHFDRNETFSSDTIVGEIAFNSMSYELDHIIQTIGDTSTNAIEFPLFQKSEYAFNKSEGVWYNHRIREGYRNGVYSQPTDAILSQVTLPDRIESIVIELQNNLRAVKSGGLIVEITATK